MEYHSFLRTCNDVIEWAEENGFPSPYGVSFILISNIVQPYDVFYIVFPSPYGVSFILISYTDSFNGFI